MPRVIYAYFEIENDERESKFAKREWAKTHQIYEDLKKAREARYAKFVPKVLRRRASATKERET